MIRSFTASVAAAMLLAGPADAAAIYIEATGTFSGEDWNDLFGTGQDTVSDIAFSVSMVYDLDEALIENQGENNLALGGLQHGRPNLVSGVVTLANLYTFHFTGQYSSAAFQGPPIVQYVVRGPGVVGLSDPDYTIRVRAGEPGQEVFVPDVTQPPSGNLCALSPVCEGGFHSAALGVAGGVIFTNFTAELGDSPVGGIIPEPSTWALMIAGFGLAGVSLRQRRRAWT